MNANIVNAISNRLSLRKPQRESLEILDRVCDLLNLSKDADLKTNLQALESIFSSVKDFERDFPSLCFALATGVGKTRLMGAFISYLYRAHAIKNYIVLAPNLTIYKKLIEDFTPGTAKYVFRGIAEFASDPPEIITGENFESKSQTFTRNLFGESIACSINIFNISKINKEETGKAKPVIRKLKECIGESYFDYLSQLDDLVVLMDESHHYRAAAGMKAINELNPILGLELTATPQVESGSKSIPFKNVIYSYPLSEAITDGFVKVPAVATRENFDPNVYKNNPQGLEILKLEDGVKIHEQTKVDLITYAKSNDVPLVKPFMLVVAENTAHADELQKKIEDDRFFNGRYKGKVIQIHSNQSGTEKDENIEKLLTLESPDNPIEIVIHVNMLKEGWDVTNLYTIVPLRAANSKTLVEQSIGRGLRLPYGKRVGVDAVDRLTIVSHDRFKEIIDYANNPDSIIRHGIVIGQDVPDYARKTIEVQSVINRLVTQPRQDVSPQQTNSLFEDSELAAAQATVKLLSGYERLRGIDAVLEPEAQEKLSSEVKQFLRANSPNSLIDPTEGVNVPEVVQRATRLYKEHSINIPRIVVQPKSEATTDYVAFDLDTSTINMQPVGSDILIQHLQGNPQAYRLHESLVSQYEERLEDYIIFRLIDFDDIDYDKEAGLLYKLAGQAVSKIQSYLDNEDDVKNVIIFYSQLLAELIHDQMLTHVMQETEIEYEVTFTKGFQTLHSEFYAIASDENPRHFRDSIPSGEKSKIQMMLFTGFSKCLHEGQKFDSNTELEFSRILESDPSVLKWTKPSGKVFAIYYVLQSEEHLYKPDFVVETVDSKYLCETKADNRINDPEVQAKKQAAEKWCEKASKVDCDNKKWIYLLIPESMVLPNATLEGIEQKCK